MLVASYLRKVNIFVSRTIPPVVMRPHVWIANPGYILPDFSPAFDLKQGLTGIPGKTDHFAREGEGRIVFAFHELLWIEDVHVRVQEHGEIGRKLMQTLV